MTSFNTNPQLNTATDLDLPLGFDDSPGSLQDDSNKLDVSMIDRMLMHLWLLPLGILFGLISTHYALVGVLVLLSLTVRQDKADWEPQDG